MRPKTGLAQWPSCEAITTSSGITQQQEHTGNAPNLKEWISNQKRHKDKSPLELCATLIREVWRLFETVWENRNKCLHNSTGAPLAHINERPNEQLVHYKHDRKSLLTYRDRHWIEHPEHVIRSWFHKKKRQLLRLLDGWHSKHKTKTAAAIKNQKSLLEFAGFTVSHPLKRRRKICD